MENLRDQILQAAFEEFYRIGYQAASLGQIAEHAGATKGALFHYFKTKADLGYAVVEEVIRPMGHRRWIAPVVQAANPLRAIQKTFRRNVRADIAAVTVLTQGCPLNNLAQEMSALDEGFRLRIETNYNLWRASLAEALDRARQTGQIEPASDPQQVAALVVAMQMGIYGTAKNSRDPGLMLQAAEALCAYLASLECQPLAAARRSPEPQRADPAGNRSPHSKRPTGATRAKSGQPLKPA